MTIEITLLVYSVALLVLLILIQASAGVLAQGLATMAGSRVNLGGVPWIRPAAWAVGLVGCVMIGMALLNA